MKIKAVGYTRVSSKGQQKDGTGLERQEQTITEFANKNDYEITIVYKEAFTGTDADRPEFLLMLAELLSNGIRVIIIERLDRLARDLMVQMQLVSMLCTKKLTLISADTGFNVTESYNSDPMNKMMLQVQGAFAELDKSMLVLKLKKARQAKKAKTGRCEGRKPYGYHDSEKPILERIKQLNRKPRGGVRLGCYEIANILNKEGLATRTGKKWSGVVVKRIITRQGWSK
ncbi:MAG: resolvase [Planctomycetes bacterium]|nr:resolvase [Planctomycetota bacterium]